jgi:hypothetical protein
MIDKNNILERRGMAKGAARGNMTGDLLKKGGQKLLDIARDSTEIFSDLERGREPRPSMLTISAKPSKEKFDDSDGVAHNMTKESYEGVMQSAEQLQEIGGMFKDAAQYAGAMANTAGEYISDIFKGVSDNPHDTNFASRDMPRQQQINKRTYG